MAAKASKMKVIAKQAADYERAKGQTVTAQLIQANPEINCIYAHNDEMALGAVAALKDAGKQPGDVKILTIDGTKGAVQGIIDGWISGVIESNPRFGPLAFKALADFYGGAGVPGEDHHLGQGVHEGQRGERTAERVLIPHHRTGPPDPRLLLGHAGRYGFLRPSADEGRVTTDRRAPPSSRFRSVSKRFGGVVALDDVSLELRAGAGARPRRRERRRQVDPDQGPHRRPPAGPGRDRLPRRSRSRSRGRSTPRRPGISTIYQEVNLVPLLSVARNLFLGHEPTNRLGLIDFERMHREAAVDPGPVRHRCRRPAAAARARPRRPADGRHRAGDRRRSPRRDHGRAHIVARAARGRTTASRSSISSGATASRSSTSRIGSTRSSGSATG